MGWQLGSHSPLQPFAAQDWSDRATADITKQVLTHKIRASLWLWSEDGPSVSWGKSLHQGARGRWEGLTQMLEVKAREVGGPLMWEELAVSWGRTRHGSTDTWEEGQHPWECEGQDLDRAEPWRTEAKSLIWDTGKTRILFEIWRHMSNLGLDSWVWNWGKRPGLEMKLRQQQQVCGMDSLRHMNSPVHRVWPEGEDGALDVPKPQPGGWAKRGCWVGVAKEVEEGWESRQNRGQETRLEEGRKIITINSSPCCSKCSLFTWHWWDNWGREGWPLLRGHTAQGMWGCSDNLRSKTQWPLLLSPGFQLYFSGQGSIKL